MSQSTQSTPPTYIGIAFYASKGLPTQWVVALSSCNFFTRDSWCGTFIASVNGQVESWTRCETHIANFAPHQFFLGTILVGEARQPAVNIKRTISNLALNVQELRRCSASGDGYPPSDEYVRRVIFHLDHQNIIRLPPSAKSNFAETIKECLRTLEAFPRMNVNNHYVIPIA